MATPHAQLKPAQIKLDDELVKKARMLEIAGDPTRIRILCLLFRHKQAFVSNIAESLDMTVACISHHLQLMRDNGYLTSERMGNNVRYALAESEFTAKLQQLICGCQALERPGTKGRK